MSLTARAWKFMTSQSILKQRSYSTNSSMTAPLRIGYVPEHFSTPLHFAQKHYGLDAKLIPFPSGTGHMVTSLQSSEIDIGIGLTEGWINGITKLGKEAKFKLIGSYVKSKLCWAISTGAKRDDVTVAGLKSGKIGISRIGSGSYVMSFVLAQQNGWLAGREPGQTPFTFVEKQTFEQLRKSVNDGTTDAFMWEHFTSKRYWDSGDIKRIGELYTPWPSWKTVGATTVDQEAKRGFLEKLNMGVKHFEDNREEAIEYISTSLDYSVEDAEAWLPTVEFEKDVTVLDRQSAETTLNLLRSAGLFSLEDTDAGIAAMFD